MTGKYNNAFDLPADFVPIPSDGKIYSKDNFFYNKSLVEFRAMSPKQEDILLNSAYIKKNNAVEKMISSCLMEEGVDLSNVLSGDKDAMMVSIRITGYGRLFEPVVSCPKCETKNTLHFDLALIPIKHLNIEPCVPHKNMFSFTLPRAGYEVIFKFLTVNDEKVLDSLTSEMSDMGFSTITVNLLQSIVSINGVTDRNKINNFIKKMSAADSNRLRKYIKDNEPGLDMKMDFECINCQHYETITIPTDHRFFSLEPQHREEIFLEPFFLLGYYFGMDFDTYYNMPLGYRKWLIGRIEKEIKKSNDANKGGGSNIPSKGAHHNTPDARAWGGKSRAHVPAKLRRF